MRQAGNDHQDIFVGTLIRLFVCVVFLELLPLTMIPDMSFYRRRTQLQVL